MGNKRESYRLAANGMKICRQYLKLIGHPLVATKPCPSKNELATAVEECLGIEKLERRNERIARCRDEIVDRGLLDQANLVKKPVYRKARDEVQPKMTAAFIMSDEFLNSYQWRKVRYQALLRSDGRCEACGAGKAQGAVLNVDHIKPRRHYPELALDIDNLQVLDSPCNHGKGNWDETDWRTK